MKKKENEKIFVYKSEIDFIINKLREIESNHNKVALVQKKMAHDISPMFVEWLSSKNNLPVENKNKWEDLMYV